MTQKKTPGLLLSSIPVLALVLVLVAGVTLFGEDVTSGASQIALLTGAVVASLIAVYHLKIPWAEVEEKIGDNVTKTSGAIFILLMIGALTSTWMLSGVVPTMIYWGLKIISPKWFLLITFLLCAIISLLAGSSWTTVGTIGVAMLSAGRMIGLPPEWLAGAIISGAYLGDKVSPLSDTTNLSSSIAGVDLYKHIRYMVITTIPALVICLILYGVAGFMIPVSENVDIENQMGAICNTFNISGWLFLIPCATIAMIVMKVSPFLTLFLSALIGGIAAFFVQPDIIAGITSLDGFKGLLYSVLKMMSSPVDINTGDALMSSLTSTGGMAGMINTVWIILCVTAFGGALQAAGMIDAITHSVLRFMKNTVSVVGTTVFTCIFCNIILADQFMSIVLPGRLFADVYRKKGLAPELLSRTLEDSATVSSVLVPWNTCAVVQAGVLGIATLEYLPYAFFCFVTPIIAILIAAFNFKIHRIPVIAENNPETDIISDTID